MDRRTTYAGSTPLETDILWTSRYAMTSIALLAQDLLGTSTLIFGATVGPTTPTATMSVFVSAGRIYSMAPIEPTAWSSLPYDVTQVLKQGILNAAGQTIPCPVLGTTGQSVNYLIEAQYQENDINNVTLSYWNASNPQMPWSGAGNNGIAQPTVRAGQFICQAKAGTPATTGSQTTPTVDSGWVPLAVVTVAFGQTTITAGNISVAPNAPYAGSGGSTSGSFTITFNGGTTAPTTTARYSVYGPFVSLILPALNATSNSTSLYFTGLPSFLFPQASLPVQVIPIFYALDNGVSVQSPFAIPQSALGGSIAFGFNGNSNIWTASGNKSASGTIMYRLY